MKPQKAPGRLALLLLTAVCCGGMLTFISQAEGPSASAASGPGAQPASLDPGHAASPDFGELVPAALKKGAAIHAAAGTESEPDPLQLRLR